ncbi:MAG: AMP-binding protein, partial [Methylococcales bacterium]
EQAAISVFYATPAMLTTLVNHGAIDKLLWQPLRLILFAGDVMPPRPLRKWMETIPTARYFNLYGPTETNVCTWFEVRRPPHEDQARIPIGCACPHVETRIVNADHATVARGQAGELWVRGPSLMSGYWGRTEHSAAAFAPDPLQPACAGGLFYRTGDRVMADSEGNLIFLGRLDNMIKTRGYRVEPEEVEAVLTRHPKVTEAAVIAVRDENEITLLKAIVAPAGEKPEIRELKRWCAKRLPDYMIPWHIEFTASLPKTSSGKLDRALLNTRLQESPRSNTP